MPNDGTGAGWDETLPAEADSVNAGAQEIRDLRKGVRIRVNKEHVAAAAASVGGEHKKGSACAYHGAAQPTKRPDGSTNLSAADEGRLAVTPNRLFFYDGTNWMPVVSNEPMIVTEEQPSGTSAGTFTAAGWRTRELNTIKLNNSITSVDFDGNDLVLKPGVYVIRGSVPAFRVDSHQARLYNVTDSSVALAGSSAESNSTAAYGTTCSFLLGTITVAFGSNKTFRLQHYCDTTKATDGMGLAAGFGETETYAQLEITKIASVLS